MEKETKNNQLCRPPEPDFLLQWGNCKRTRGVKVQVKAEMNDKNGLMKRTTIRVDRRVVRAEEEAPQLRPSNASRPNCQQPSRPHRTSEITTVKSTGLDAVTRHRYEDRVEAESTVKVQNSVLSSPEKSDRLPMNGTRVNGFSWTDDTNKISTDADTMQDKPSNLGVLVWPKFMIALSSKEKEEDFMAIKGSKLPQRPKKRAKFIQRALHLVSPGAWLPDLSQDRYEVREKKSVRKRPRGLKAMGNLESDSE